jgi:hypothetical protein
MAQNPLQQYFRQPKVFIGLPSNGVYNKPGTIAGDANHMPVFGMTGMDEILMKTPDALLAGESTVKVIESCCPFIKDAWNISVIDLDLVLAAIRIATYGNTMNVKHVCPTCSTENEYDINLSTIIEHSATCKYDNSIVLDELTVKIRPITYKESTDYSQQNFQIRQKLLQTDALTDEAERKKTVSELIQELAVLQNAIIAAGIESVNVSNQVVSDKVFILEWLQNADKTIFDRIKERYQQNQEDWRTPDQIVVCESCSTTNKLAIELDNSNFFENA